MAAVAPSGWRGPLINELSQPRSLGRARGRTSVCHSGLTPPPSPAVSRSPRDFPDVSRFPSAVLGPLSPIHHPDIAFVTPECLCSDFPPKFSVCKTVFLPPLRSKKCLIASGPDVGSAHRCLRCL